MKINFTVSTAEHHNMAPERIEEITLSEDVKRGSPNPSAPSENASGEGTSRGARSSGPPETHDSDIGKHPFHTLIMIYNGHREKV